MLPSVRGAPLDYTADDAEKDLKMLEIVLADDSCFQLHIRDVDIQDRSIDD